MAMHRTTKHRQPGAFTTRTLAVLAVLCGLVLAMPSRANADAAFAAWWEDLWPEAQAAGISRQIFEFAFSQIQVNYEIPGVRRPGRPGRIEPVANDDPSRDDRLPKSCQRPRQSEFLKPANYFQDRLVNRVVDEGRAQYSRLKPVLEEIQRRHGVKGRTVLAIWGRETNFGRYRPKFNTIEALASLAFAGPEVKRPNNRVELIAGLKILEEGHIDMAQYTSSWAGATGYTQFTPTVFEKYATDFDGDGRKDIWNSIPDVLASTARYLNDINWQDNEAWGYEVVLPQGFDCSLEDKRVYKSLRDWQALGIRRATSPFSPDATFPRLDDQAQLLAPGGASGPAFLILRNFEVFRKYNKADLYALYLGHVMDRILCDTDERRCTFQGRWPANDDFSWSVANVCAMQTELAKLGYSDEEADGLFGRGTRAAYGRFQKANGLPLTCYPSKSTLDELRRPGRVGQAAEQAR